MEPSTEGNEVVVTLKRTTEVLLIAGISLATILFSMMAKYNVFGVSLFLCVIACFLIYVIKRLSTVQPIAGMLLLWCYWLIHSYSLRSVHMDHVQDVEETLTEQHGISGLWSVLYSLLLFFPVTLSSSANYPPKISSYRIYVLLAILIIMALLPNADSNIVTASPVNKIIRWCLSMIVYVFMVYRYTVLNLKMTPKYGIVIMLNIVYLYGSNFWVCLAIFCSQMVVFTLSCVKSMREKTKRKPVESDEEGGQEFEEEEVQDSSDEIVEDSD